MSPGAFERGLLLGLARLGAGPETLDRLPADIRDRCLNLSAWVAARPDPEGVHAEWARARLPAHPPGLECVHDTWLHAALVDQTPAVLSVVGEGAPRNVVGVIEILLRAHGDAGVAVNLPVSAAVAAALRWALLGHLADPEPPPDMTALAGGLGVDVDPERPDGDGWLRALQIRGAQELGVSLSGTDPRTCARAMASVGEPFAGTIARAVTSAVDRDRKARAQVLVARASQALPGTRGTLDVPALEPRMEAPAERLAILGALAVRFDLATVRVVRGALAAVARCLPLRVGLALQDGRLAS